jgi:glutamate-1-semialdehyde 2,1-aminomutase
VQAEALQQRLTTGLRAAAAKAGVPLQADGLGTMFGLFFAAEPVTDLASAEAADHESFRQFYWDMLAQGVYLAPSAFEAGFLSTAHSEGDIEATLAAAEAAMHRLRYSS